MTWSYERDNFIVILTVGANENPLARFAAITLLLLGYVEMCPSFRDH